MPIFRVTFGFAGANTGWSETHAKLDTATDPLALAPVCREIAAKRALMLGSEFYVNAIRIARYAKEDGTRFRGVKLVKEVFAQPNAGQAGWGAEPAAVALKVRGDSRASTQNPLFDANENETFLGGPIDDCVDTAGRVYPGRRGLGSAFASWAGLMTANNFGWLASETIVDTGIVGIDQNEDGTVRFQVSSATIPPLVQGQTYKARVRRVNGGNSPLNGEIILTCTGNLQLDSYEIIGLALAQTGGRIRIYKQVQPFVAYGTLTLNSEAGNHKRGRPFLSKPGRARKRIRG